MIDQLRYALKENNIVFIDQVESGLQCLCKCPSCNGRLIARKGEHKVHHFAHYKEDNCKGGIETAIHLKAKEIIEQSEYFTLPPLISKDIRLGIPPIVFQSSVQISFDEVQIEKKMNAIIPDIIAYVHGKPLLIEIAVTHFIEQSKLSKIKSMNIATLEIDLSNLDNNFSESQLSDLLLHGTENKTWVHNPKLQKLVVDKLNEIDLSNKKIKKRQDLKEKELKTKLDKAYQHQLNILTANEYSQVHCPMKAYEKSQHYLKDEIVNKIQSGSIWNGVIYGKGPNGRRVFISNEKVEIFPPDKELQSSSEEYLEMKKCYGRLKSIAERASTNFSECQACEYFVDILNEESQKFSCSYSLNKA